jgi:hypothetical protein
MKKMRYLLGLIMISSVMFIANSCSEDVPTYVTETFSGCNDVTQTHMKVLVCDITQTNYYGGASVYMYLTEADRTNDPQRQNAYRTATTDNTNPATAGAVFYQTPYQKYYFFARVDLGGGNFITGVNEAFPIMCATKEVVVPIK